MRIYNCAICKNKAPDGPNGQERCAAFPEGIPKKNLELHDLKETKEICNNNFYFEKENAREGTLKNCKLEAGTR